MSPEKLFENEVRKIAQILWPDAENGGAQIIDGREKDGIYITQDFVHLIECTTSRGKDKASEDGRRLDDLIRRLGPKYPDRHFKGFFITKDEPTGDQRTEILKFKNRVVAMSFDQFRSKLVDATEYLRLRALHSFGSFSEPGITQNTGHQSATAPASPQPLGQGKSYEYIPLDILIHRDNATWSPSELEQAVLSQKHIVLTGEYGAGKSATLKHIFQSIQRAFHKGKLHVFPIYLSLREHHGQTDPVEAIERHARAIGFAKPADLVRAWRAGLVVLLLDGFDEIATAGWTGSTKRFRDLRYRSMELLRRFVRESKTSGLVLAGRSHFFDSLKDMVSSLDLRAC